MNSSSSTHKIVYTIDISRIKDYPLPVTHKYSPTSDSNPSKMLKEKIVDHIGKSKSVDSLPMFNAEEKLKWYHSCDSIAPLHTTTPIILLSIPDADLIAPALSPVTPPLDLSATPSNSRENSPARNKASLRRFAFSQNQKKENN